MICTETQKEEIYRNFHGKVFGYIYAKTNQLHTAEDLAADVFVKVFDKLDSFDPSRASLSTWVFTITRNTLTDYYRTRKTFDEIPNSLMDSSSVEEDICRTEMLETLADALEQLDERERDIIILRYYSGRKLKDIAIDMRISYSYAKILQNKALSKLRKSLETI